MGRASAAVFIGSSSSGPQTSTPDGQEQGPQKPATWRRPQQQTRQSRPAQSSSLGVFATITVHYTDTLTLLRSIFSQPSEAWPSHTPKPSHPTTPLFLPTKTAAPQIRPSSHRGTSKVSVPKVRHPSQIDSSAAPSRL